MSGSNFKVHRMYWIGNFFLVIENDELTLIDTGARNSVKNIAKKFRRLGYNLDDLKRIVITHCHVDHAGSLSALKRATKARVFAHKDDVPYVTHQKVVPRPKGSLGQLFAIGEPFFRPEACDVDVALNDGDMINNTSLKVIHTPGHTPGHICLYHEGAKALFTGDIMVNYFGMLMGPRPFFSSDIDRARSSLERLVDLDIKSIYFSHGMIMRNASTEAVRKLYLSLK